MHPILFSAGSIDISAFGLSLLLAFLIGTFVIWKIGRDEKVSEEKILDTIFTSVAYAFFGGRFMYILIHFDEFSHALLRIFLIWKFPGLSLIGAFLFGVIGLMVAVRKAKLHVWQMLDIYSLGFLSSLVFVGIGTLLDGTEIGRVTAFPVHVPFAGYVGFRHPIGLYEMVFAAITLALISYIREQLEIRRAPFGITAIVTLFFAGVFFFVLAFLKEEPVYLAGLSMNQVVMLLAIAIVPILLYYRTGRKVRIDLRSLKEKVFFKKSESQ